MNNIKKLSKLNKTWFFDLDGTLVEHNAYILGQDVFLPGVYEFLKKIPNQDIIVITTSRSKKHEKQTKDFFKKHNLKVDYWIFGLPYGERLIFNDRKISGLDTAFCFLLNRNEGFSNINIEYDEKL